MDDDANADRVELTGLRPLATVQTRLERVCAACVHSAKEGKDRVCRFEPPRVFMFMVPVMQAPMPGLKPQSGFQITTHTAFPVVRDDQWCGKWSGRQSFPVREFLTPVS